MKADSEGKLGARLVPRQWELKYFRSIEEAKEFIDKGEYEELYSSCMQDIDGHVHSCIHEASSTHAIADGLYVIFYKSKENRHHEREKIGQRRD